MFWKLSKDHRLRCVLTGNVSTLTRLIQKCETQKPWNGCKPGVERVKQAKMKFWSEFTWIDSYSKRVFLFFFFFFFLIFFFFFLISMWRFMLYSNGVRLLIEHVRYLRITWVWEKSTLVVPNIISLCNSSWDYLAIYPIPIGRDVENDAWIAQVAFLRGCEIAARSALLAVLIISTSLKYIKLLSCSSCGTISIQVATLSASTWDCRCWSRSSPIFPSKAK